MALAWNTRQLLSLEQSNTRQFRTRTSQVAQNDGSNDEFLAPTPIEFHFLSRRKLYDNTIATADHSSADRWAAHGDHHWYTVEIVRQPIYGLPQELCLSFDCFHRTDRIGDGHSHSDLPIDEVAVEFVMLVSLLAREPLLPIGARRIDGRPVRFETQYVNIHQSRQLDESLPPAGINSRELGTIIQGLAKARESDTNAIMAASRLYHAALLLSDYDVSTAYFSLVSAIECVSGHHFKQRSFNFDDVEKFRGAGEVISKISSLIGSADLIEHLKREMLKAEHFVWQKFRDFIEEFLPKEFWQPDELHSRSERVAPLITKERLRRFLREAYDARSKFAHTGEPFPAPVELGIPGDVNTRAMMEGLALMRTINAVTGQSGPSERFVPTFVWFERLTHLVLREYVYRVIAPTVAADRERGPLD